MDKIFELLKDINIAQLAAIGCMFWFFYSRLDAKIDKLELKLDVKIDGFRKDLKEDIKDMQEDIRDLASQLANIDKRVYGIERILEMKECCALKSDEKLKKAE